MCKRLFMGSLVFVASVVIIGAHHAKAQVCCPNPQAEVAQRDGGPYLTYDTQWKLTVSGGDFTYSNRWVFEYPPSSGYTPTDTCYFGPTDTYPPMSIVTGGMWLINSSNQWGDDYNGYNNYANPTVTQYYQSYYGTGVDCGATAYQLLEMSCGDNWNLPYTTSPNFLTLRIYSDNEVNYRQEFSGQQVCAKEPQGVVDQPCQPQ